MIVGIDKIQVICWYSTKKEVLKYLPGQLVIESLTILNTDNSYIQAVVVVVLRAMTKKSHIHKTKEK